MKFNVFLILVLLNLTSCAKHVTETQPIDLIIKNGTVYLGDGSGARQLDIAVCQQRICGVYPSGQHDKKANKTIDASGKIVSPGFIDPHTHTLEELLSQDKNANLNYLTQGVTTVVNGNDGDAPVDIAALAKQLKHNGTGTNVALLAGHNSIRAQVMGKENRHATTREIEQMSALLSKAMEDGALGLSTGLYYVPGSYAATEEVIHLAQVAAQYGGIYDTHLRDESTFNIGFIAALKEAINIAQKAKIHLHLAHLKALGVDVWGESKTAIATINDAKSNGVSISADQYPWLASGTKLHSAIMPKWAMADSKEAFYQRLNNPALKQQLTVEISENIRRRGGAKALLITAFHDQSLVGKTLADLASDLQLTPTDTAIKLVQLGDIRVASFNMSSEDLERIMQQPWVVTSSDGTNGHPRKYASFPKKYKRYVKDKALLSIEAFIMRSSSQTAKILNLGNRGQLKTGWAADIIVWDANNYAPKANFSTWNKLSTGIDTVIVNGTPVITQGIYQGQLSGQFLKKQ